MGVKCNKKMFRVRKIFEHKMCICYICKSAAAEAATAAISPSYRRHAWLRLATGANVVKHFTGVSCNHNRIN